MDMPNRGTTMAVAHRATTRPSVLDEPSTPARPWRGSLTDALRRTGVRLGVLGVLGVLAANPFVLVFVGVVATAPLTRALRWWEEKLTNRSRVSVAVALLVAAEAWQLHRYGLLP